MRTEYCLSERKSLESEYSLDGKVAELQSSVDAKGLEVKDLNVAVKRSALIGVWTPLVDLLSVENLTGEADTSDDVSATTVTTTALSTTFASASFVPPITIEDYEIVGTDGQEDAQGNGQGNVALFPTVEFEKKELDTTPERDHLAQLTLQRCFLVFLLLLL
ncbi:hypothetical protein Tco_0975086 [Tanacetum coccineum]|uniref:Uncharacterized protein n=1 Tax=Tanacetum coccineum TaxID=301880 RepID=A0ABQ5EDD9_9ASTR